MSTSLESSEAQEQMAVVGWCKYVRIPDLPKTIDHYLLMIPNGTYFWGDAKSRAIMVHKWRKMGYRDGASDLFLAIPQERDDELISGLYIEMKRQFKTENARRRAVSDNQLTFIGDMSEAGYDCCVAYGASQAIDFIKRYLSIEIRLDS